jgi:hypothetical protein
MMTQLPTIESSTLQQAEPYPSVQEPVGEGTSCELDLPDTAEQVTRQEVAALRCGAARRNAGEMPVDLNREGTNMAELQMRQSCRCETLLSISSKATQALLRQF